MPPSSPFFRAPRARGAVAARGRLALALGGCWLATAAWADPTGRGTIGAAAQQTDQQPIVVGVTTDSYPYGYLGNDDQWTGFAVDLLNAVAHTMDLKITRVQGSSSELQTRFRRGEFDMLQALSQTAEREEWVDFSVPFITLRGCVFVRKGANAPRNIDDLSRRRFAVSGLKSMGDRFLNDSNLNVERIRVESTEDALRLLNSGSCDATFASEMTARAIIARDGLNNVRMLGSPLEGYDIRHCYAVHQGNARLLAVLNEGLLILQRNGEFDRIYRRWFGAYEEPLFTRQQVVNLVMVGLGVGFALALGGFLHQRRLREQIAGQATELAAGELILRESELRLSLFAQRAPAAVAMFDREMRYLVVTRRWVEDFGLGSADAAIGRCHYDLFPETSEHWKRIHQNGLAGNTERCEADAVTSADGEPRWSRWEVGPWFDTTGQVGGIMVFTQDITAQKQLEAELALARDQAIEASRLKSEFLANMSHEIRTPMNGVIGMADVLQATALTDQQTQMVRVLYDSAEALLVIINDILDISKIEAGRVRLDLQSLNPLRLVEDVIALLEPRATAKQLHLQRDLDPGANISLIGDATRIRQILTNLLGNAIKFTAAGTVTVSLQIRAATSDHVRLRCTITDTGVGIPPEVASRLFQPFVQADSSTTRRFGGTGLGLAISRQLAELMSGCVNFESQPGRGSRFWFEWDLTPDSPAAATAEDLPLVESAPLRPLPPRLPPTLPAADTPVARPAPLAPTRRILVAEDQVSNQFVIRSLLDRLGYACETAGNGRKALDALAADPTGFDLVFMDCQMPELDGYAATRQIRAGQVPGVATNLPIVALTANAMSGDRETCLAAGMDDFLSKPVRTADIVAVMARFFPSDPPGR